MNNTIEMVRSIEAPAWTNSWHPIAHGEVINAVENGLEEASLDIVNRRFDLTGDGNSRLFAKYVLATKFGEGTTEGNWMVGFRNSIDKSMSIGVTAGTNIIVCSNMIFSGDFIEFRKHTGGLLIDDLYVMMQRAVGTLITRLEDLVTWQLGLLEVPLSANRMKRLTYDAIKNEAIAPSMFWNFHKAYIEEQQLHGDTLYTFHAACTRALREKSLNNIAYRTANLNAVVDSLVRRN